MTNNVILHCLWFDFDEVLATAMDAKFYMFPKMTQPSAQESVTISASFTIEL
jgi:hypothetical protein